MIDSRLSGLVGVHISFSCISFYFFFFCRCSWLRLVCPVLNRHFESILFKVHIRIEPSRNRGRELCANQKLNKRARETCIQYTFHVFFFRSTRSVLILVWLLCVFHFHLVYGTFKPKIEKKQKKQQHYHEVAKQKLREENERRTIHTYVQKIRSVHRHSVVASLPSWSPVCFFSSSSLHSSLLLVWFFVCFFLFILLNGTQMRWSEMKTCIEKRKRNAKSLQANSSHYRRHFFF